MRKLTSLILIIILLIGCSSEKEPESITVFAAVSLQEALNEIFESWPRHEEIEISINYQSSGVLARQIISGAVCDVYISANSHWMEHLKSKFEDINPVVLAGNSLVLCWVPSDRVTITKLEQLLEFPESTIAIGDPAHVPSGMYAKEALENADLWHELSNRCVFAIHARAALTYVTQKMTDFSIVYASDLSVNKDLEFVDIKRQLHQSITYKMAKISKADSSAVDELYLYLQSSQAQKILEHHGFKIGE